MSVSVSVVQAVMNLLVSTVIVELPKGWVELEEDGGRNFRISDIALRVCYSSCGLRNDLMSTVHGAFHLHFCYHVHDAQAPRVV